MRQLIEKYVYILGKNMGQQSAGNGVLNAHMDKLVAVAERLMVAEKMDGDDFRAIMEETETNE